MFHLFGNQTTTRQSNKILTEPVEHNQDDNHATIN